MTGQKTVHWGAEALWEQLVAVWPDISVEVVHSTPSTNSALLARARVAADAEITGGAVPDGHGGSFGRRAIDVAPCLLVAEHQTAGRGRQGRHWLSAQGASLTFSLGVPLSAVDLSGLSLAVGVALCEALAASAGAGVAAPLGLKWPNDLWLGRPAEGGRKLGGILIETVAGRGQRLVVIGVGLNVHPLAPAEAPASGIACTAEFAPDHDAPALLARLAPALAGALRQFEAEGFAGFAARFAELDLLRDCAVRTTEPVATEGIARGVSPRGALRVDTARGPIEIASGEVSVRPLRST